MCVLFTNSYLPGQPATATGEHYGDVRRADFHGPDRREGDHPSLIGRTIVRRFRITIKLLYYFRLPKYRLQYGLLRTAIQYYTRSVNYTAVLHLRASRVRRE